MTSARLTNSTARDRFRLLRINSRRSGGANAILPRLTAASVQHITQLVTDLLHLVFRSGTRNGVTGQSPLSSLQLGPIQNYLPGLSTPHQSEGFFIIGVSKTMRD